MNRPRPRLCAAFLSAVVANATAAEYEPLEPVPSAAMFSEEIFGQAGYRVAPQADNDGWMNRYWIESDFQRIEARGSLLALERMREQEAIAALKTIKNSDAYARGIEAAAEAPLAVTRQALEDPVSVMKALPQGLSNLLDDVSNALGGIGKGKQDENSQQEMLKSLIGYHTAKRRLAAELGIDPYSSNEVLQVELNDVTWSVFAGSATIDVAIAGGPMAAGLAVRASRGAQSSRGAPWNVPPATLNKAAADALVKLGLGPEDADAVVHGKVCTLTHVVTTVSALAAIGPVRGSDRIARGLALARNEDECRGLRERAELAWVYHTNVAPLVSLRESSAGWMGEDANGTEVFVVRADYLRWTESSARVLSEPGGATRRLWISGTVSPRAASEVAARGFELQDRVFDRHPVTFDVVAILLPGRVVEVNENPENQTGKLVNDVGEGVGNLLKNLGGAFTGGASSN